MTARTAGTASHRRPLPPYGRELAEARRRGEAVNLFVHAGVGAWERAKARGAPHVLCLPPGSDFNSFDWTVVRGLSLMLIAWDLDEADVEAFGRHLVTCGAELVMAPVMGSSGVRTLLRIRPERTR